MKRTILQKLRIESGKTQEQVAEEGLQAFSEKVTD